LPGLDVLINAAGGAKPEKEYREKDFLDVMDINLNSLMRLSMAAYPLLARSTGSILNIASMLSYLADDVVPAYCASKSGVLGLTRALAHRFGPEGIRVDAIAPVYHETDMTKALWSNPDSAAKKTARSALKRWGAVEDPSALPSSSVRPPRCSSPRRPCPSTEDMSSAGFDSDRPPAAG
jgi:NAD(P)-dependent dehydrogenase (short-subunit alcohol dehydrogenase family)